MNDKAFVIGVFVVLSAFLIALTVTSVLSAIKKKKGIFVSFLLSIVSVACVWFSVYLMTLPERDEIKKEEIQSAVTFSEIFREYEKNELRADELYKNNRYIVTATINGMETDGLLNWSGGATLTMETRVDNTIVFFYAEFEKEQEEALKDVNVGDEITFEGECLSAGTWVECELIE